MALIKKNIDLNKYVYHNMVEIKDKYIVYFYGRNKDNHMVNEIGILASGNNLKKLQIKYNGRYIDFNTQKAYIMYLRQLANIKDIHSLAATQQKYGVFCNFTEYYIKNIKDYEGYIKDYRN